MGGGVYDGRGCVVMGGECVVMGGGVCSDGRGSV